MSSSATTASRDSRREPLLAKVPEITALFWVIKIMTTGMGESTSDYLGNSNLVLAGVVGVGGFALALWLQFRTRRYLAAVYWFAVLIAIPAVAWWRFGLNEVVAFWSAYVVTRPLGASFADWFGKSHHLTGLGYGDGSVAGWLTLVISSPCATSR